MTIFLVWLPGFMRIIFIATDQTWAELTLLHRARRVIYLFILFLVWPLFSILM